MKSNHLLKSMMLAVFMILGTVSIWGAGYTRTLSDALEVAGYKFKAFYNFQTNTPEVLPTSGDLRYRDGNIWGLHNFGSGSRSGTATIPVAEEDILVLQIYSDNYVPTINRGSLNSSLTSSTGYQVYNITTTADDITFSVPRYGGIVAALVMEKDASASTADYIVNYLLNGAGEPIKTVSGKAAVSGSVVTDASFFVDDVKYFRADGQPESFTIAASGNTFNVNVRQAATYNYTLLSSLGATLATGSGFEGESVSAGYPRYQLKDGVFYEAATTNKEYRKPVTLSENNISVTVDYTEKENANAVFYVEGENVEGMTVAVTGNIPVRASNAKAGVATEDVTITNLSAGKYKLHVGIFASKTAYEGKVVNFAIGGETFAAAFGSVNLNEVASDEYTLNAAADVKFVAEGSWADAQFDYIWIEKTGDVSDDPAALAAAKEALQTAIDIASNINPTGFADAISAAQTALTAEDATVASIAQATQTLEAAIKTYFGEVLPNLGAIVTALNDETLNGAYADAQTALAKEDVTPQELATAMQGIITAAQGVAPAHLQNLKGYAVKYGATDAATLIDNALAAIEAGNVAQIITTMTAVKEAATPLAQTVLSTMKNYVEAFGLTDQAAQAQAALESGNYITMITTAKTLFTQLVAAAQTYLPSLEAIVEGLNDATLNAAYADAVALLANESITPEDLGTAMQNIITAAQAVAPEHLQNLRGYAVKYGEEDAVTKVDAAIAAIEAGNVSQIIATMTAVKEAATPLATGILTQMIEDAQNYQELAEDVTAAQTALESGNYITMIIAAKALYTKMTDYTSYIVNADLTGEGGFDATGTKGFSIGIVKVGNASAFDFKQTIANLPAGKYKVTAQAAYRYGADEAAEYAAINGGTDTKLVQLYATVGTKTVSTKVMNRWDGASETNYFGQPDGVSTVNEKFVPNSSDAVKAWFAAGQYVNEVVFNLPADGAVTIGINRTGTPESDYTVIGPWTLTRLGDAEAEPVVPELANADFEGEYTVFTSPKSDRDILKPAGWTVTYENGEENDMTALNSHDKAWDNFSGRPQLGEAGGNNTYWVRFRWGNSEKLTLSQEVALPAGTYKLSADAFFNGANGASATISAAGQSTAITGNSTWANHNVVFTVAEDGPVTIALNVTQTQAVENVAAFDNLKLESYDPLEGSKAELQEAITAAKAIETEGKTGVEELNAAITAAEDALNDAAATAESLAAAKTALAAAIAEFEDVNITVPALAGWTRVRTANIENVDDNYYVLVDAHSLNYVMANDAAHFRPCYKTVGNPVENPAFVWKLAGADNKFTFESASTGAFFKQASGWNTSVGYARDGRVKVTGEFTLNNGKYVIKCVESNALVGHWNDGGAAVAEDGENIAANKQAKDAPGFYLFAMSKASYEAALKEARTTADVAAATKDTPVEVTSWMQNADFSNDWGGWENTLKSVGNMQWGQKTLEVWNASDVIVKQTLIGVPDGTYKLTADVISGNGDNKVAVVYGTGGATVKSDAVSAVASAGDYGTMSNEVAGKTLTADNIVVTGGVLTVGLDIAAGWIVADNFKLYYCGEDMSQYIKAYHDALTDAQAIDKTSPMNAGVLTALNSALTTYASVDETNKETLLAAATALSNATEAATASIAAYVKAADVLPKMKELTESTNVYTAEAYEEYYGQWANKYEARTLTDNEANALQNPYAQTGWHDAITCDNFLLSAWDTNPDFPDGVQYYINTWSVEGNNDGTEFRVPFFEYWTGDASSLGAKTMTATVNGLEEGVYEITAWVRVRTKNETGADVAAYGITLQANEGEAANVADGATKIALDKNNNFFLKEVSATGVVAEDGVLNIKFNVASDNNVSWIAFKNVKYTKITSVTATAVDDDYFTFSSEYPVDLANLPSGLKAYYVDKVEGEEAYVEEATGAVAAGTGLLLKAEAAGDYEIPVIAEGNAIDGNLLVGVLMKDVENPAIQGAGYYVLIRPEGATSVVFSQVNDEASVSLDALYHKAYLYYAANAGKLRIVFPGEATAINSLDVEAQKSGKGIYNLSGQKVNAGYKGIVIVNGKKVMMK